MYATITHVPGTKSHFELRDPSGGFVCQGPLDFILRQASANGWQHVCK